MTNSSRAIPLVLAAVLLLGACGSADPDDVTADPSGPPTTGEDDGLRAPTPIELAEGGSSRSQAATEAAPLEAQVEADSGRMIAPVWISDYVVGDALPPLPTADTGYVYEPAAGPSADQVAALAAVFGVSGEPTRLEEGPGWAYWRVGPTDGTAPTVEVQGDAQMSWYFSAPWAREAVACAVAVDSEGNEIGECPEPEPPVGVPSAAEADARARGYLTALGLDPAALVIEPSGDDWSAHVHVEDRGDGRAALRTWSFGFGEEGVLQWASGSLATPEAVGPYPLIDVDTAIARLREGPYGGFAGGPAILEPSIAVAEAPPAEAAVDVPEGAVEGGAPGSPGDEAMPAEPIEPVEAVPVTVTLVDVQADLWWAWDVHGSVWLLPAYRFIDADGGWHVVPAVTDEFLVEVPLPEIEPLPEPLPAPEPEPVDPGDAPDPGEPVEPEPDRPEAPVIPGEDAAKDFATELSEQLPLPLDEVTALATERGLSVRVVVQDGEALAVTADYSPTRLNVEAVGDSVTAVASIG